PLLDSPGSTTDDNLPAITSGGLNALCGSPLLTAWTDAQSTAETVGGLSYRVVRMSMGGAGNDAAYLVRYDDNRDDEAPGPASTTNNNCTSCEGPLVGDVPYRDRDQTIFASIIGVAGLK